jgi:hypothetical protein
VRRFVSFAFLFLSRFVVFVLGLARAADETEQDKKRQNKNAKRDKTPQQRGGRCHTCCRGKMPSGTAPARQAFPLRLLIPQRPAHLTAPRMQRTMGTVNPVAKPR